MSCFRNIAEEFLGGDNIETDGICLTKSHKRELSYYKGIQNFPFTHIATEVIFIGIQYI